MPGQRPQVSTPCVVPCFRLTAFKAVGFVVFKKLHVARKVFQQQLGHVDRHPLLHQNPLHNHVFYIGRQAVRGHQPTTGTNRSARSYSE